MPDLVYNVKFNIQSPQTGGGISQMTQQAQAVGQSFSKSTVIVDQFGNTVETAGSRASEAMGRVVNSTNRLKTSQQQLTGQAQRMNSSFSSTNQLMFSFSDGIQDASQFSYGFATGMRAVGNNIGFTAELFANLKNRVNEYNVANQAAIASGKAQARTMKSELLGALKGPGGVILALNLAITAVTMFSRAQEVAKKKTEEAKGSIDDYAAALRKLRDLADPTQSQRQEFERNVKNLEIAIGLAKQLETQQEQQRDAERAYYRERSAQASARQQGFAFDDTELKNLEAKKEAAEEDVKVTRNQIAQYTDVEAVLSKLEGAYNTAIEVLKTYNGEVRTTTTIGIGGFIDTLQGEAARALAGFTAGVDDVTRSNKDGANSIAQIVFNVGEQIDAFRELAKAGNTEIIPAINHLIEIRDKLIKEAIPELGMESKDFTEFVQGLTDDINKMFEDTSEENIKQVREAREIIEQDEVEALKRRTQALIDDAERRKLEEKLYWQFTVKEASVGRDTVDEINEYYDKKQIEEELKLKEQGVKSQEVFNALAISLAAQREEEITRLTKRETDARTSNELQAINARRDAYAQLVMSVMGLGSALFKENKAIAIAETLVSTYFAAQKAYASTIAIPGVGIGAAKAAAAAAVLQGLARVAMIKKTEIGSSAGNATSGQNFVRAEIPTGFASSGTRESSYMPVSSQFGTTPPQAQINLTVDETGFALYMQNIEGKLQADTMAITSS